MGNQSLTSTQPKTNALVVHSNAITRAAFQLGVLEMRILLCAISKVRRDEPLSSEEIYWVKASDLVDIGSNSGSVYQHMQSAGKSLRGRFFTLIKSETRRAEVNWFLMVEYDDGNGQIGLQFSPKVIPYLSELKEQFTKYRLKEIAGLSSFYAIRLYEMCAQYRSLGQFSISIAELRACFLLENKYSTFTLLRRKVIDIAVDQINGSPNTEFSVSYSLKKTKKTFTSITFAIKLKNSVEEASIVLTQEQAGYFAFKLNSNQNVWHAFYNNFAYLKGLSVRGCDFITSVQKTSEFLLKPGMADKALPWLKEVGFKVPKKGAPRSKKKTVDLGQDPDLY